MIVHPTQLLHSSPPSAITWAILAGEYPPQTGGVSDYTWLVARALAEAGDQVHVWAPTTPELAQADLGIDVRRLPGHFGPRALAQLRRDLADLPRPFRILVQYVPHAFGWKAMNVPFAMWLFAQRQERVWVMFHEVAFPLARTQPLKHNVLGAVTRVMAALVARAAERCFVAIPEWDSMLRRLAPGERSIQLLPVPSNVPTSVEPSLIALARAGMAPNATAVVVGHFGTFGGHIVPMLREIFPPLLRSNTRRIGALLGRGGREFAAALVKEHPDLEGRVFASGGLSPEQLAAHLAACDLLIQPYPDGASSRRGSLMAGLGLGMPIVTTDGFLTEPHWRESGAVALAPVSSPTRMIALAEDLLGDPDARKQLRARASALYAEKFALEKTIHTLRTLAQADE